MVSICPRCSRTNSPKAKFCPECGFVFDPVGLSTGPGPAPAETAPPREDDPPVARIAVVVPSAPADGDGPPSSGVAPVEDSMPDEPPQSQDGPVTASEGEEESALEKQIEELSAGAGNKARDIDLPEVPAQAAQDLPIPAVVEVRFGHALISDCRSSFSIRLRNVSRQPWKRVQLRIESTGFTRNTSIRLKGLEQGVSVERPVEVRLTEPGHPLLNCTLEFDAGRERICYAGSRPIRVLERPATPEHVSITLGDILCNRDGAVVDAENANISNLVDLSKIQKLNDLLNLELPGKAFEAIRLYEDFVSVSGRSQSGSPTLVISDPSSAEPGAVLVLRPLSGDPSATITLVARSAFRIGRSRASSDFAPRFLPRSPENDERSSRLSKDHVICEENGAVLQIKDANSANGTFYENKAIQREGHAQLERRGLLELAADFRLQAVHFPSAFPGTPPIGNLDRWVAPAVSPRTVQGAVRFEQPPDTPDQARVPWRALWLLTDATFGDSHANPLPLRGHGMSDVQGRFHAIRGCFLLENLFDDIGVCVNGRSLRPGELCPIRSGTKIHLGSVVYQAEVRP